MRYIGRDRADIRYGDIYDACEIRDDSRFYGVVDRSGDACAYPKCFLKLLKRGKNRFDDSIHTRGILPCSSLFWD